MVLLALFTSSFRRQYAASSVSHPLKHFAAFNTMSVAMAEMWSYSWLQTPTFLLIPSLLCVIVSLTGSATATVYHAYPDPSCQEPALADQGNLCTVGGKSFSECISSLKVAGDECRLHAGRYPFRGDPLPVRGLHGTEEKPFVIAAAPGDESEVLLDGTVPVTVSIDDRNVYAPHSNIYAAKAQTDFWQMFVDDVMQTNARWPNALWSDLSVFNASYWAHSANTSNSTAGIMVDDGSHGEFPNDLTGAVAILNTGSWNTYPAMVLSHAPGSHSFTYNASHQVHDGPGQNRYFIEGKMEFIDQPTEWLYNKTTGMAYFIPGDRHGPYRHTVTGKVSAYALNITDCKHLVLANLTFFATTIWASSIAEQPIPTYIDRLTVSSVNFSYPSYSRRMLQDVSPPQCTLISSHFYDPTSSDLMVRDVDKNQLDKWTVEGEHPGRHGRHSIFNCTWMYTDGPALIVQANQCNITNNYFAYNDWSGADSVVRNGGVATISNENGHSDYFARNTLYRNGAMTGYQAPVGSTVEYNLITGQCWGDIEHDGAGVQLHPECQANTTLANNWAHDSLKYGLRLDGQPPHTGSHARMTGNVAWNSGGLMVKGDYHTVNYNLAFDLRKESHSAVERQNCSICVLEYVGTNPVPVNSHTTTVHNVADFINGGTGNGGHSKVTKVEPLPGLPSDNVQTNVREEVMDVENLDFRPRKNSTFLKYGGVGPYVPTGDRWTQYWIPGRQSYKASTPIPPDGSATVKTDRDSVMWLIALNAQASRVTFLASCNASLHSHPKEDRQEWNNIGHEPRPTEDHLWSSSPIPLPENVYYLPTSLKPRTKYCWKVDTIMPEGTIVPGDVWSFTTK